MSPATRACGATRSIVGDCAAALIGLVLDPSCANAQSWQRRRCAPVTAFGLARHGLDDDEVQRLAAGAGDASYPGAAWTGAFARSLAFLEREPLASDHNVELVRIEG